MDSHQRARLTRVLDDEGLDALVATTTENLYYVTGFRSIAHALFRGLELYGVFTRRGIGLVIPFIDTTGVAADAIQVDHLACYGKFFFQYADDPGAIGVNGVEEKSITLAMAHELQRALQASGRYQPYLTREGDEFVPLRERIRRGREARGSLFISLHADAMGRRGTPRGSRPRSASSSWRRASRRSRRAASDSSCPPSGPTSD